MHKSVLILPALKGTLGLYDTLKPLIPPGFRVIPVELAKATKNIGCFRLPTIRLFIKWLIRFQGDNVLVPNLIVISSCGGSLVALEFCRSLNALGMPAKKLILIDPPLDRSLFSHKNFSRFATKSVTRYLVMALKVFRHQRWLARCDPSFRYRILLRLRSAMFYCPQPACPVSLILSADREAIKETGFSGKEIEQVEFYSLQFSHSQLFREQGLDELGQVIGKIISNT